MKDGYIDDAVRPTSQALAEFRAKAPKNAIILAAGFGMRMVPINTEMPKGLLEVNGEPLIERTIKLDEYDVQLIVNPEYAKRNNLQISDERRSHFSKDGVTNSD